MTLVLIAGIAAYQLWVKPAQVAQPVAAIVPVERAVAGAIEHVIRVSGVTSSINFANIRALEPSGPDRSSLVLLDLAESGVRVKRGDVVARIDGESAKAHVEDVHSTVVASLADVKKRRAEQQIDWETLRQEIHLAKADLDRWQLEAGASEIRTVIDREIIKLAVEEASAAYEAKRSELDLKKTAHDAEVRILELTSERHKRHRDLHASDLEKYAVRAPMEGMVVRQAIWRGGEMSLVQTGDQLFPGRLFLKVMDTREMQVEAEINQAESEMFRIGQVARIGLDAFEGATYEGRIYSIGALAKTSGSQNDYIRKIPIRIHINNVDERLLPDLSAFADVVVKKADDAVLISRAALFDDGGEPFVYVKNRGTFEKRPVKTGLKNHLQVAIVSGIEAGEEVALRRPGS
ncbi:MAG: efflux RND transporter periplasmic adaptor subunit [Bryobacteraceae bacterium]|nr:efflux RND transporter periplasmic adaptor subunit [Bryobacteraceae bacterium]